MSLLLFLSLIIILVNGQDVLIYPSSSSVNGTSIVIETHPYCLSSAIQFNGSSSLFLPSEKVWVYQQNKWTRPRSSYVSYLTNPTVLPITGYWWVFPCQIGDVTGGISPFNYIPADPSYSVTSTCEIELPAVFACMGNVPSTQSPSLNPSKNPSQPTRLPSRSPSLNPTHQPTRIPTSDTVEQAVSGFVIGIIIAFVIWTNWR